MFSQQEKTVQSIHELLNVNIQTKETNKNTETENTKIINDGIAIYTYAKDTVIYPKIIKEKDYNWRVFTDTCLYLEKILEPSAVIILIEERGKNNTMSFNATSTLAEVQEIGILEAWTNSITKANEKKNTQTMKMVFIHKRNYTFQETKTLIEKSLEDLDKLNAVLEGTETKDNSTNNEVTQKPYQKKLIINNKETDLEITRNAKVTDNSSSVLTPVSYLSKMFYYLNKGNESPFGEIKEKTKITRKELTVTRPEIWTINVETTKKEKINC